MEVPKVVCVKVAHIRPDYHDLKEWMADPENLYIGRGGVLFIDGVRYPPRASPFANPFKIGKGEAVSREVAISMYRDHLRAKLSAGTIKWEQLDGIKRLGCWCAPLGCHGDIIVEEYLKWKQTQD